MTFKCILKEEQTTNSKPAAELVAVALLAARAVVVKAAAAATWHWSAPEAGCLVVAAAAGLRIRKNHEKSCPQMYERKFEIG